jgi:hypothetical protein
MHREVIQDEDAVWHAHASGPVRTSVLRYNRKLVVPISSQNGGKRFVALKLFIHSENLPYTLNNICLHPKSCS